MRAIIYIRVSTKLQEKKFSLDGQRTELTRYAESMGWQIVATYQDADTGGRLDKKGMNALLDDIEDGKADVVLVFDQDRLSRLDVLEWEFLKDVLRKNNVKISEPGRLTDLSNDDDEFFSDLKNLIARREKKSVVRRMMNGKKQKMRKGETYGKGPFEYRYNTELKKFESIEEFAWVIPFIDNLYLNKQLGMSKIADELNAISKTPTGRMWNEHLIHTRIISKAYHGIDEKTFSNGETIAALDVYEPLRTKETYEQLQAERVKRNTQYRAYARKNNELHLFRRTKFICGECGRQISLCQHGTKKTPRYYLKHGRRMRLTDGTVCDISINTIRIEPEVRNALKKFLLGEEFASQYIKLNSHESDIAELEKTLASISKRLNDEELKKDKILDLYLEGRYEKNRLAAKEEEIQKLVDGLKKQQSELSAELDLLKSESWGYDMIYNYISVIDDFETSLTPLEQAQTFGNLFPTGKVYRDKVELITHIQGAPVTFTVHFAEDPFPNHRSKQ